jgi:hypothetical protein
MPRTAQIPIFISTLGKNAFQLAGQIADGIDTKESQAGEYKTRSINN